MEVLQEASSNIGSQKMVSQGRFQLVGTNFDDSIYLALYSFVLF